MLDTDWTLTGQLTYLDMKIYSLLISFDDVSPVEKMVIVDDPAREVRLEK